MGGDGEVGVQGEAHGGGAAGCGWCRQILEATLPLVRAAAGPDTFQTPTFFPLFCSSSHFLSGAK